MEKFDLKNWLDEIQEKILKTFNERVLFIGIQGSFQRGEATENSDIDMVILLDKLSICDLKNYQSLIKSMPYSEKACGFISGIKEIENWSKTDIFQFIYDTKPLFGSLKNIIKFPSNEDVKNSIKINSEALYHSACHSFLYDKNTKECLIQLYKRIFFILQAEYFLQNNKYISTKLELMNKLEGIDKQILNICINQNSILTSNNSEIENLYEKLIKWASHRITNY